MALIRCTECGKSFSDKADCCPNCGCPTRLVLKETKAETAKKKKSGLQPAIPLLEEVKKAAKKKEEQACTEKERKETALEKRKEAARKAAETRAAKKRQEGIVAEAKASVTAFEKELDLEIDLQIAKLKSKIEEETAALEKRKKEYESALLSMGFFSFSAKKKIREQIQFTDKKISKLTSPQILEDEREKMKVLASRAVAGYEKEMKAYLAKRFPSSQKGAGTKTAEARKKEAEAATRS